MVGYRFRVYDTFNKTYLAGEDLRRFFQYQITVNSLDDCIEVHGTTRKRNELYRYVICAARGDEKLEQRDNPMEIPSYSAWQKKYYVRHK